VVVGGDDPVAGRGDQRGGGEAEGGRGWAGGDPGASWRKVETEGEIAVAIRPKVLTDLSVFMEVVNDLIQINANLSARIDQLRATPLYDPHPTAREEIIKIQKAKKAVLLRELEWEMRAR